MTEQTSSPLRRARPKMLARAARAAAKSYRRGRDCPRAVIAASEGEILPALAAEEERQETARRAKSPAYRPAGHVQILAALLAEAQAPGQGKPGLR